MPFFTACYKRVYPGRSKSEKEPAHRRYVFSRREREQPKRQKDSAGLPLHDSVLLKSGSYTDCKDSVVTDLEQGPSQPDGLTIREER